MLLLERVYVGLTNFHLSIPRVHCVRALSLLAAIHLSRPNLIVILSLPKDANENPVANTDGGLYNSFVYLTDAYKRLRYRTCCHNGHYRKHPIQRIHLIKRCDRQSTTKLQLPSECDSIFSKLMNSYRTHGYVITLLLPTFFDGSWGNLFGTIVWIWSIINYDCVIFKQLRANLASTQYFI